MSEKRLWQIAEVVCSRYNSEARWASSHIVYQWVLHCDDADDDDAAVAAADDDDYYYFAASADDDDDDDDMYSCCITSVQTNSK